MDNVYSDAVYNYEQQNQLWAAIIDDEIPVFSLSSGTSTEKLGKYGASCMLCTAFLKEVYSKLGAIYIMANTAQTILIAPEIALLNINADDITDLFKFVWSALDSDELPIISEELFYYDGNVFGYVEPAKNYEQRKSIEKFRQDNFLFGTDAPLI